MNVGEFPPSEARTWTTNPKSWALEEEEHEDLRESATCFSLVLWISLVMWASAHPSEPMGLNVQKGTLRSEWPSLRSHYVWGRVRTWTPVSRSSRVLVASQAQGSCPWYQPHIHTLYLDLTAYLVWIPASESGDSLTILAVVQPLICVLFCDSRNCSMPGFPVLHYLPEFAHTHVCWVSDGERQGSERARPHSRSLCRWSYHTLLPGDCTFLD